MATKQSRMHGRVEGAQARCAVPGCSAPGEYKAPLQPANFDGPGHWRFLCLDHVREHNAKYNFFEGMSTEEITRAQHPLAGWERPSRRFNGNGADPPPRWSDFVDPLDAISGRFGHIHERAKPSRFSKVKLNIPSEKISLELTHDAKKSGKDGIAFTATHDFFGKPTAFKGNLSVVVDENDKAKTKRFSDDFEYDPKKAKK